MSESRVTVQWRGDEWLTQAFIPAAQETVKELGAFGVAIVKESMKPGGASPGSPPAVHSGGLRRSIASQMVPGRLAVLVGTNAIQGRIVEFGGTIVPRKQKALCIPLNKAAQDAAGKMRAGTRAYSDAEGPHMRGVLLALMFKYNGQAGARMRPKGIKRSGGLRFVYKGRPGKGVWGVVARGAGKDAPFLDNHPKFAITKRAVIRAHPYLRPLVNNPANVSRLQAHAKRVMAAELKARSFRGAA